MRPTRCDRRRPTRRRRGALIVAMAAIVGGALAGCGDADEAAVPSTLAPTTAVESSAQLRPSNPVPPTSVPSDPYAAVPWTPTINAYPPPYVDHVEWAQTAVGPSLQIYPTPNGRRTADADGADIAWREVIGDDPSADTPGMRAQFDCHWNFARAVAPDKPSWNLEPSRPVVTDQVMFETRCNPGAPEE